MPLIQITLPEAIFNAEQEQQLAERATQALLKLEGMDKNPKAQMLSWIYLQKHPQADYFIGGKRVEKTHYRFDVTIFANTLDDAQKEQLTQQLTQIILELEKTDFNRLNAARVWVLFHEVANGNWGGAGQIYHLKDLMQIMSKQPH